MTRMTVGEAIPDYPIAVRAEAMKPMALLLKDPNPIHWDSDALRALGLDERPVNQGPLNVAYLWEALTAWTGDPKMITKMKLRFVSNALAGEHLTAGGEVSSIDELAGSATCTVWVRHDDGQPVLTGTAMIKTGERHASA
ncbi:MaoC family dehydratase [Rhodococcus koreensis]